MKEWFRKFAQHISILVGSPGAFGLAVLMVIGLVLLFKVLPRFR